MSIRVLHTTKNTIYFGTFTCHKWLPLIEKTNLYDNIYNWFKILEKNDNKIIGYVIMPNHLHLLIFHKNTSNNLNKLFSNGKRFLAYEIIKRLKEKGCSSILEILSNDVELASRLKGQNHKVFKSSFDAKECYNEKMIWQKLDYMHHNPVKGKWALIDDFRKYSHSSAGYYELNLRGKYLITDFRSLDFEEFALNTSVSLSGDTEGK